MLQDLIEHPRLSEPFPSNREFWTSVKTGLKVPMRKEANLVYREKLLRAAERDPVLQRDLLAAATLDGLWWINSLCWTYHQFETDPETGRQYPSKETHQPWISWECQDEVWEALEAAFQNGEDILISKSRDMGASWLCAMFCHHKWLFRPNTEIRMMSMKEDLVDSATSRSLFWKNDYLNTWLPEWMRPPDILERGTKNRTKCRMYNELNQSTISGESTNKHAMTADRCKLMLLDEFSKCDDGEMIRTATADVTPCRIVNSTPTGAGTEYSRWKNSGQIKVVSLMFWQHPQKGAGRYVIKDSVTGYFRITSPWLERQLERRTQKEVAQECYAEDLEAGDTFFDLGEIEKHAALYGREPTARYNIALKEKTSDDDIPDILRRRDQRFYSLRKAAQGKLEVWVELIDGRPDQGKTYCFGIDTSTGRGASESVVSIKCKQTGELIAKWRCRNTPPHEFARVIMALALWCGGANPQRLPFLKWEKNGPGLDLGKLIVKVFKYPFYYKNEQVGTVGEKKTDKYGWHSSRDGKLALLQAYERGLHTGKIVNHDKRGLEQAKFYIFYPGGGVGPAELQDKNQAEILLHGDIVIADALTTDDAEVEKPKSVTPAAPKRSWGGRFEAWKQNKLKTKGWRQPYDFR